MIAIAVDDEVLMLGALVSAINASPDISEIAKFSGCEEALDYVKNNLVDVENTEPTTFGKDGFENPESLLKWLKENQPKNFEPVLSHGDFCLPNVFLLNDEFSGLIDLGGTGVADKYQDIALCYRSLKHNFGGVYGGKVYKDFNPDLLFEKLGITPDWEKIRYYTLLDELF